MAALVEKIIDAFKLYHQGETACNEALFRQQLGFYIEHQQTIPFVFLAFPGKSINERSVSGYLPDLGEQLALENLRNLIAAVEKGYSPGMELHIISEGHCFIRTGCMRPANELDAYVAALKTMKRSDRIVIHTIHDFYPQGTIEEKIAAFERDYMPDMAEVYETIEKDPYYAKVYPDRLAFVYHEFSPVLYPDQTNSRRQSASKVIARSFIAHQMAVTLLMQRYFPGHIRLSIHQQHNPAAAKYYINLLPNVAGKGSPWFYVVANQNGRYRLVKNQRRVGLAK